MPLVLLDSHQANMFPEADDEGKTKRREERSQGQKRSCSVVVDGKSVLESPKLWKMNE